MTALRTTPTALTPPDGAAYSIDELRLLDGFNRESYFDTFGEQAPEYDPSRVLKSWMDKSVDLSDPSKPVTYKTLQQDAHGNWSMVEFTMPAGEAATVNLPGVPTFPPYSIAPTDATRGGSGINPKMLSLKVDADSIEKEIGGRVVVDTDLPAPMSTTFPIDEPRRLWGIVWNNGKILNAGELLAQKYARGIGAPYKWDLSGSEPVVVFLPIPDGSQDKRPPAPVPMRDLLPVEKIQQATLPGNYEIVRTDRMPAAAAPPPATSGDGFTAADRAMLTQVRDWLELIVAPIEQQTKS